MNINKEQLNQNIDKFMLNLALENQKLIEQVKKIMICF